MVKLVQNEVYQEEIGDLKKRGNVKSSSGTVRLRTKLVNGILRVNGGHISEAPIVLEAKFPSYDCSLKRSRGSVADPSISPEASS